MHQDIGPFSGQVVWGTEARLFSRPGEGICKADALTSGQWTHDYPIAVAEARELGFTVSTEMPRVIYDLMQLYPQSGRRRPSVEYVPLPYRAPATPLPGKREPR